MGNIKYDDNYTTIEAWTIEVLLIEDNVDGDDQQWWRIVVQTPDDHYTWYSVQWYNQTTLWTNSIRGPSSSYLQYIYKFH
jgi:hypothetical protein